MVAASEVPERRHACATSVVPAARYASARSSAPNVADPVSGAPSAENSPRSQSPSSPLSSTVTIPDRSA
jgi:hypothetical protein